MIKNFKIKQILLVLTAVSMILSVVACSGQKITDTRSTSNTNQQDSKVKENTVEDENSAEENPVTITMINTFVPEETNTVAYVAMRDKFLEANPNVILEEEILSSSDACTKCVTLASANELPDIFVLKAQYINDFIGIDVVRPINDILDSDPEYTSLFIDGVFDNFSVGEKIYGIPYQITYQSIYYNSLILQECGYSEFPATWDELIESVGKIKEKGYIPIAMGDKDNWVLATTLFYALASRHTGVDWFNSLKSGDGAKFTDQVFINALEDLKELYDVGAFNEDWTSIDNAQQKTSYFYTGKAAMVCDGSWAIGQFTRDCPEDVLNNTKFAVLPAVDGVGPQDSLIGAAGWAYCVSNEVDESKMDTISEFLKMISGEEFGRILIEECSIFPAINVEYDTSKIDPFMSEFISFTKGRPTLPAYAYVLNNSVILTLSSGLQEMLLGLKTPLEVAEEAQNELNAVRASHNN